MKTTLENSQSGQTLLELVVSLAVVALVLTGLIAAVTSSLRYGQASKLRSLGVKYAQEGIELTRKLRDTNTWDVFMGYSGLSSKSWCLSQDGVWTEDSGGGCPMSAGSQFWRTITLRWNDPVMTVVSEITWGEREAPSVVTLTTVFTKWR